MIDLLKWEKRDYRELKQLFNFIKKLFILSLLFIPIVHGVTIGKDKHISSNSSVVISFNDTITLSGIFLNRTSGYVLLNDGSIRGATPLSNIGLKPEYNITINKIGNQLINYTSIDISRDKVYCPIGEPSSFNGCSLYNWNNVTKVVTISLSSLNVELRWGGNNSILIIVLLTPMLAVLILVFVLATRMKGRKR
jgi:hypothetical protein